MNRGKSSDCNGRIRKKLVGKSLNCSSAASCTDWRLQQVQEINDKSQLETLTLGAPLGSGRGWEELREGICNSNGQAKKMTKQAHTHMLCHSDSYHCNMYISISPANYAHNELLHKKITPPHNTPSIYTHSHAHTHTRTRMIANARIITVYVSIHIYTRAPG